MQALVTGGTGFAGSHLVRRLLQRGDSVRVLDSKEGCFSSELRHRGAEIRLGTITDRCIVEEAVEGCDVVFHLAAAFRELKVRKRHYWEVNVEGTRNVADTCLRLGTRKLVYCSTQGVHGNVQSPPGSEESPVAPEDYYQYTKYEGEVVINEYVERGLCAVTLRPTAIYGPGDPARFLKLFRVVNQGRFLMFGRGTTYYHPVHIDNLVDAFELAAEPAAPGSGEAFIIGDDQFWSLNDLVRHVARALNRKVRITYAPFWPLYTAACVCEAACAPIRIAPPLFRRRVNWFRQDRAFSIQKARSELNYTPRISIDEGLVETGRWYRDNNYL